MDSSDSDDTGAECTNEYELPGVGLKPVLDNIFKEVEASIPVLNFEEFTETSSDEDNIAVYSRNTLPLKKHFAEEARTSDSGLGKTDGPTGGSSIQASSGEETGSTLKASSKPSLHQSSEPVTELSANRKESQPPPVISADQVMLDFGELKFIDANHLLERCNEVSVSSGTPVEFDLSGDSDSDTECQDKDALLMRELESLQEKQLQVAAPAPNVVKPGMTDQVVMAALAVMSRGVSARLEVPCNAPRVTQTADTTPERETVFLDLRRKKDEATEQKNHVVPSSIRRILGIDQGQGSSSSSDDDDDALSWQQHRQRMKEGLLQPHSKGESQHQQHQRHHILTVLPQEKTMHEEKAKSVATVASVNTGAKSRSPLRKTAEKSTSVSRGTSTTTSPGHDKATLGGSGAPNEERLVREEKPAKGATDVKHEREVGDVEVAAKKTLEWSKNHATTGGKAVVQVSDGTTQTSGVLAKKKSDKKRGAVSSSVEEVVAATEKNRASGTAKKRGDALKVLGSQEKEKRARLQQALENLRPPLSSGGHQAAAPATPVVFDQEASYEAHVEPLPPGGPRQSCLLLCARLASCGELASSRGSAKGGLTSGDTHCFSCLVAWLLCLVPPPAVQQQEDAAPALGFRDMAALCDVPFHVIGLQQKWHEGQLTLDVAIRCRDDSALKHTSQSNKHGRAGNAFKQAVTKFLSTNSLHSMFSRVAGVSGPRSQYLFSLPKSQRNLSTQLSVNPDPDAMSRVLGMRPGFFWQTVELEDTDCGARGIACAGPETEVQTTVMSVRYDVYHLPFCSLDVMTRVWKRGFSVAGLRLVYDDMPASANVGSDAVTAAAGPTAPLLLLAIRGPRAVAAWLDEVGPQDANLARRTDPTSLRAAYSASREDMLFSAPRNPARAKQLLARWFGGRVPDNGVINVGTANYTLPSEKSKSGGKARTAGAHLITSPLHGATPRPPCFLASTVRSLVFLVLSPLVPVRCLGFVMSACYDRGFVVQGLRRTELASRRMAGTGLSTDQVAVFCPSDSSAGSSGRNSPTLDTSTKTIASPDTKSQPLPADSNVACTVLLLSKENSVHHVPSLIEMLAGDMKRLGVVRSDVSSHACFAAVPFNDLTVKQLGGALNHTPEPSVYSPSLWRHSFYSNPELEQTCVLTLLRGKATTNAGTILDHLLLKKPLACSLPASGPAHAYCGFELLGIKLMDSLSMHQAKEFSPFEIGGTSWHGSLGTLMKGPVLVCVLRGRDAFERLRNFIQSNVDADRGAGCPDAFMSPTAELAFRQLSVLFHDRELWPDPANRANTDCLPPGWLLAAPSDAGRKQPQQGRKIAPGHNKASVMQSLLRGPRPLVTVCIVKPDAAAKHAAKILRTLSQEGFSIVAARMGFLSRRQALLMVPASALSLKASAVDTMEEHVQYAQSGPCLLLGLMRENAVAKLLDVLGPCDPQLARKQSQFLLRGCYGVNLICNALYGSSSYSEAARDAKLFFPQGLCCPATVELIAEKMTCLSHDDIFDATTTRSLSEVVPEAKDKTCSGSSGELPSSLLEINCILLTPSVLLPRPNQTSKSAGGLAEVMDWLAAAGFRTVGLRMSVFGESQAEQCVQIFGGQSHAKWKPHLLVKELVRGPCIVLAVLRGGAVTRFDTLLSSSSSKTASVLAQKHNKHILVGKTIHQAGRLVECFFDELMPNNKVAVLAAAS